MQTQFYIQNRLPNDRNKFVFYVCLGVIIYSKSVYAEPQFSPPLYDTQANRLFHALPAEMKSHYKRYCLENRQRIFCKYPVGRAEIFIHAPLSAVRAAVLDFARYPQMNHRFQKVYLTQNQPKFGSYVYLQIGVLGGAIQLWAVEHFTPPLRDTNHGERVVSTMLNGNVDNLTAAWRYRAVDATHTILKLDIYIEPRLPIPIPYAWMSKYLEDACGDGVRGVRNRAEELARTALMLKILNRTD